MIGTVGGSGGLKSGIQGPWRSPNSLKNAQSQTSLYRGQMTLKTDQNAGLTPPITNSSVDYDKQALELEKSRFVMPGMRWNVTSPCAENIIGLLGEDFGQNAESFVRRP